MTQDQAKEEYIEFVAELAGSEEPAPAAAPPGTVAGLDVTTEAGVLTIRLNRPEKFNALTWEVPILSQKFLWNFRAFFIKYFT